MLGRNESKFTISVVGEVTQEKYVGNFKCKSRLSHADRLRADRFRREMLGPNPEGASPRAASTALVCGELSVRVIDGPPWWTGSEFGTLLEDDTVLGAIWDAVQKAETDALEELKKKSEEAAKELQKSELLKDSTI